jgi:hypothetical protein
VSVRTTATVWDYSQQSGPHLLLMLAIADFSDDEGRSFPAVATLAQKCRMKPRNAQTLLAALKASGELEVNEGEGPRGTNLFRIRLDRLKASAASGGVQAFAGGVQELAGVQSLARGVQELAPRGANLRTPLIKGNRHEPVEAHKARQRTPDGVASTPRATRLPADWQLPEDWRVWCVENRPGLDPDTTAEAFRDYWHAKPGKDACKLDWLATWRNWCRNQRQQPSNFNPRPLGAGGPVLSANEQFTLEDIA